MRISFFKRCNHLPALVVTFTFKPLTTIYMVTLMTFAHLVCAIGVCCVPTSDELENFTSTVEFSSYEPLDWSTWCSDERRMTWWQKNGWRILEGQKPGSLAGSIELSSPMSDQWSPMDIGLVPVVNTLLAYALIEDETLVLYSLQRCDDIYLRALLANSN